MRHLRQILCSLTIPFVLFCFNTDLEAQNLINVDTGQGNKTGSAVVGHGSSVWNRFYPEDPVNGGLMGDSLLVPLSDDTGAATGAGMLMYGLGSEGNTGGWGDEMFDWYLASTASFQIYVTNLSSGFYDLYVYMHGANDSDVGLVDVISAATWHGRRTTGSGMEWNDGFQTWSECQNYVKFDDVAIPQGSTLFLDLLQNANGLALINGFQLQPKTTPAGDFDGDGILNANEIASGTDPWSSDSDFDGITDNQETLDGTDPTDPASTSPIMLAHWSFDDINALNGSAGQIPIVAANIFSSSGVTNNAIQLSSSPGSAAKLIYRRTEVTPSVNAVSHNGSVKFHYQPLWDTSSGGPGTIARLLEMGTPSVGIEDGSWTIGVSADGSAIEFVTRSTGVRRVHLSASISWSAGQWHEILLEYTPTNSVLHIDGTTIASGSGVTGFIKLGDLSIGSDGSDGQSTPAQWNSDPCGDQELLPDGSYDNGYWTGGTWVEDPNETDPRSYHREVWDFCFNLIYDGIGYWDTPSDGNNGSAHGLFDELTTYNYPITDPPSSGPPQIATHPQSQSGYLGSNLTLSVTASGNGLSYQWYFNGAQISGATTSSLTLTSLSAADAGEYSVIVSNSSGPEQSNIAVVTVVDPNDLDGDGLSNADEAIHGTDELDPDSDNDGLTDGEEVALGLPPTIPTENLSADPNFLVVFTKLE